MTNARQMLLFSALPIVVLLLAGCGGGTPDRTAEVSNMLGVACVKTDYTISGSRIYDCYVNNADRCVTLDYGIVSDRTAAARILFADALNVNDKPPCAAG